jgi:hypothetical protein
MITRKIAKQIPHACPVCKGRGEIGAEQAQHEAQPKYEGQSIYACHVCGGSCLIWEMREEDEEVVPPLTQIQLPPTIISPNLPNIGLPQLPYTVGDPTDPYRVTWASATNNLPEGLKSYNSPGWSFTQPMTDHICGSIQITPKFCNVCFQGGRYVGAKCSCSPEGMPHSEDCKGWQIGNLSYESINNTAPYDGGVAKCSCTQPIFAAPMWNCKHKANHSPFLRMPSHE